MKGNIEDRVLEVANYIIENKETVRNAAKVFKISKSTVHKDITERLKRINKETYLLAREVLDINKAERHLRGGEATRKKYK